ncbi:MAG: ATP-binding protein, partial [Pseudohongiellaceae bacterium]
MTDVLQSSSETLTELRQRVLFVVLSILAIAAPSIAVLGAVQTLQQGAITGSQLLLFLYTATYPLLWFVKKFLPFPVLAVIFIGLLSIMGFMIQTRGGLTMSTAALQLITLVLSGLVFGQRGVLIVLLLNLFSFAVAAYLVLNQIVPPINLDSWNPELGSVWLRYGIILALVGGASALAVTYTLEKLEVESQKLRVSLEREQHQRIARELAEQDKEAAIKIIEQTRRVEALGRMASGIAHDFNNSLTVILTSAEMAQRDPYLSMRTRKYMTSIKNSAMQAAEMTKNLLALSRKEASQQAIVNSGEVLHEMSASILRLLPADIEFSIDETTDAEIEVDRIQLERALFNMIINARDSFSERGRITIGCRKLNLMSDRRGVMEGSYIQFWVKDNGKGMPVSLLENIFDPYFTINENGQGVAMGLEQVKAFASEAGGKIEIDSGPGSGTRFYLYIPAFVAKEKMRKKNKHKGWNQESVENVKATILIVEDNTDVLTVTATSLAMAGFEIATAADSDIALELIKQVDGQFDLLCIDGVTPGVGSSRVIEYVRNKYPRMKIVVCSGYIEEELILRGIRTGEMAFVRKPYL